MKLAAATTLLLTITPLLNAQAAKESSANTANPITTTVRQMEQRYAKNLTGAAETMPVDKYSYKPTAEQGTFGHLMMHVAETNNELCAAVAGEPAKSEKLSETDSKEALTKAVKDSFAYCEQVLGKAEDTNLGQSVSFFGRTGPRGAALVYLASSWGDHYSEAAMYLRLNNLLPPSAKK
jgi:DinB superfamily